MREVSNQALPKLLLTVPETCHILSMGRSSVYRLITEGKIPVVKMGRGRASGVRIRLRDLERFVENA